MSDGRLFFTLHGMPILVTDREDEHGYLRNLEAEVEAAYNSTEEGVIEEDIGEGLDPDEDPLDDLINVRDDSSDDEDPDEDPMEEEGTAEHPIVLDDDDSYIDWEEEFIHIDDPLPGNWYDDQDDGPDEEEGEFVDPIEEDQDEVGMWGIEEIVGLEDLEDPIWDFPEGQGDHQQEGPGEPEVVDFDPIQGVEVQAEEEEDIVQDVVHHAQQHIEVAQHVAEMYSDMLDVERDMTIRLRTLLATVRADRDGLLMELEQYRSDTARSYRILHHRVSTYPGTSGQPSGSISRPLVMDMITETAEEVATLL